MKWEDDFREYLQELDREKPVIMTGDLNVAHEEIDLKNPALTVILHGFQRTQIDVHFITHAKINRPVMTIRSQRTVEKSLTAAKTSEGHRGP